MLVRRAPRASGGGAVGIIAAIIAFGLLGLGLRAYPRFSPLTSSRWPHPRRRSCATVVVHLRFRHPAGPYAGYCQATAPGEVRLRAKKVVVPATGPGTYQAARERAKPASDGGRLIRFDVKVERNLDIPPDEAAKLIAGILNDRRSWRGTGRWRFELVSAVSDQAELHAYIVTPGTTDRLCAPLQTRGEVSCQNGDRVVLNAKRWQFGARRTGPT